MTQAMMTADSADEVLYAVEDGVATITLNRPERMNTISAELLEALGHLLLRAESDSEVRAVVLAGSGRAFCAGLDLRSETMREGTASLSGRGPTLDRKIAPPTVLFNMDKPTICALTGSAAGYGMDLAIGCDIRIMSAEAKLAASFTKRGVLPESGGTWLLPRMIGWPKASELIFTGRTIDGAEALALGIVNRVVPAGEVLAVSQALAREIAANAPLAVQASKRMMRTGWTETFNDHVHHVYLQLLPLFGSADASEGMAAFMQKRPAVFKGA